MPQRPAKPFDFEAELEKILGPDPNDPNKGAKAVRAEDFLPEGPGFAGRAVNEMLPDFVTAGKTLLRTPLDMAQAVAEAQKNPLMSAGPGGPIPFLMAQGLVGGVQDAWTLLKSLGAGASALSGGNPEIPQGVPEAGGRALGAIATARAGGRMAGRMPGMSTLQSLLKEKMAAPAPKPAPRLGMAEADAIRMLLGPEGPAPRPSGPMVEVPADLGFRTQMGPGETVLRALLPERFQRPHQLPADVGVLDTRFTGNQPPSPGFRPSTPAPPSVEAMLKHFLNPRKPNFE